MSLKTFGEKSYNPVQVYGPSETLLNCHFAIAILACIAVTASFLLTCSPALAQPPAGQRLAPAQPRSTPPIQPPDSRPELPPIEIQPPSLSAPADAEGVRFVLAGIIIDGITVFPRADLEKIYAEDIGTEVSLTLIYAIAEQIQQHYRSNGYLLARAIVPPQTVRNGIFRIRVIEGFISQVRLEGKIGPVLQRVQSYCNKITQFRPVRTQDLERYLLLANDVPGVSAFGVLQVGSELGASELVVKVERKPFEWFAALNNRGSKFTGPLRAVTTLRENSATLLGESIAMTLFATEDSEEQFGQLAYTQLLGSEGLTLGLDADYGQSEPGLCLKPLDTETESKAARASLSYPFIRSREKNLYLTAGFDAINQEVKIFNRRLSEDHLRVLHASAGYDFTSSFGGHSLISMGLRRGLDIFGASDAGDDDLSRYKGDPTFTTATLHGSHDQPLINQVSLYFAAAGQYAFNKLLNDELFRVGGDTFGRGYDPSELSGDHGLGLSAEVRYTGTRSFGPLSSYQAYCFYDFGAVWLKGSKDGDRDSLASAGLGLRTQLLDNFWADVELAWPLTQDPVTRDNDGRLLFQLSTLF